jgi:hypothetical protein
LGGEAVVAEVSKVGVAVMEFFVLAGLHEHSGGLGGGKVRPDILKKVQLNSFMDWMRVSTSPELRDVDASVRQEVTMLFWDGKRVVS